MAVVPLIILTGESNSGGFGNNNTLRAEELAANAAVQILNNTTLLFEDLDVGTNNQLGHDGIGPTDPQHGFEVPLLNSVLYDGWGPNTYVYLVKCGQGGSAIAAWNAGGTFMNALEARVAAALSEIAGNGDTPLITIWISLGLNDITQGTNINTFKSAMENWISRIRTAAADATATVLLTKFSPSAERDAMNTALGEIATNVGNATAIDTMDVGQATGSYHWIHSQLEEVGLDLMELSRGWTGYTLLSRLQAFWPLNEASGSAIDAHSTFDLTETSGTIATGTGLVYATARDLEADDTEHFAHAANDAFGGGEDNWTAMIWFKPETLPPSSVRGLMWNGGDGGTTAFKWGTTIDSSGALAFIMGVNGTTTLGPTITGTVSAGAWTQLVVGFDHDNTTLFAFKNGEKFTLFQNGPKNAGTGMDFLLGAAVGGAGLGFQFDGLFGPCAIWRRVLTDAEVVELYNAGAGMSYEDMLPGRTGSGFLNCSKLFRVSLVG